MIPIIKWELRRYRTPIIWWSISVAALVALTVLAYGSIHSQADQLNKAFGNLGNSLGSFLGTSDIFSPAGYLNSQLFFITLPATFIILSIIAANTIFGKDEANHTLELLLARPVSRTRLFLAKFIAHTVVMLLVGTVTALVAVVCARVINLSVSMGGLVLATYVCVLFSDAFGKIACLLLTVSLRTQHAAMALAILASMGSYLVVSLSGMVHWLSTPAKFLPYHYYTPNTLLTGHLPLGLWVYVLGIYALCLIGGAVGFRRRDID